MKKFFFISIILSAFFSVMLIQCTKETSGRKTAEESKISKEGFKEHLVSSEEAKAMMERYDQWVGSVIEEKYKAQNQQYISPTSAIYDIDPLIQFLSYLRENGNDKVVVRYAAIDGDEANLRVPGFPYHSLLFFGKKTNINSQSKNAEESGYFDHGDLIPPCTPCPDSDCDKCKD